MALKWVRVGPQNEPYCYDNIPGMDPAANWLLGPGCRTFLTGSGGAQVPALEKRVAWPAGSDPEEEPAVSGAAPSTAGGRDVQPVVYPRSWFDTAVTDRHLWAKRLTLGATTSLTSPHVGAAPAAELPDPPRPETKWPEDTVVMAVIDDGICFAHEAFRDAGGTSRVQSFWRQDGQEPAADPTVPFGQEIFKEDLHGRPGIDTLLDRARGPCGVDETKLYREAGLVDFARPGRSTAALRRSHGTHVLDLAAGYEPASDRRDRPIIAVQLPAEVVEQSSGATLGFYLVWAVKYILERARRLSAGGPPLPVVITLSYGVIAGPHDGTTLLEIALDQLLDGYEGDAQMVLSAGNSHLSRCHAEVAFQHGGPTTSELEWRVHPDDRTSSYVEIWLPYDPDIGPPTVTDPMPRDNRIAVSVVGPDGVESAPVPCEHGHTVRLTRDGRTTDVDAAAEIKYAFVPGETQRGMFRVTLGPTALPAGEAGLSAGQALAPAGVWRIRVHRKELAAGQTVNAWVQRDDTIYGYPPRGRQSYFVNPCYKRFDVYGRRIIEDTDAKPGCVIRRRSLLNAIATGERVVVVGSYRQRGLEATNYTAGQPIAPKRDTPPDPGLRKPDALMVAEGSRVLPGMLAAGTRSGSAAAMGGTSVAAPALAREMADWMHDGGGTGRARVKREALRQQDAGGPFENAPPLNADRGGWGRIKGPQQRISVARFHGSEG